MESRVDGICGNSAPEPEEEGVWTGTDEFGSLAALPPELLHSDDLLSKFVLQEFNNLPDLDLKQVVVEDTEGRVGMNAMFADALEYKQELRFFPNVKMTAGRLMHQAAYMDSRIRPYTCAGPKGLPNIIVFSEMEMKRIYSIVDALATNPTLRFCVDRLGEAMLRFLKIFPNTNLKKISGAFNSTPLAFVTHVSRLKAGIPPAHPFEPPFKGHLSHTFLSSSTNTLAIHVPAHARSDLEGYTLADVGSHDISLVQGCRITYTYDESSNMYHVTASELGQAKIPLDALSFQMQGLPVALSGRNMIGIAFTGSGKIMVFAIPLVTMAWEMEKSLPIVPGEGPLCMILAPSRELARQTFDIATEFAITISRAHHVSLRTSVKFRPKQVNDIV